MLTGENGILTKADNATTETEKEAIIEDAKIKILEKQTENLGTLTERELTEILEPHYGTLSNDGEETVLTKTLTTTDGKYQIPVKEIYQGLLTKEKAICTIDGLCEIHFMVGDTWFDVKDQLINAWQHHRKCSTI